MDLGETMMQLAGHLKVRALQEYKLLLPEERDSHDTAIKTLLERLDPEHQSLAALDFRHIFIRITICFRSSALQGNVHCY